MLQDVDAAGAGAGDDGRLLSGPNDALDMLAADPPLDLELDVDRAAVDGKPAYQILRGRLGWTFLHLSLLSGLLRFLRSQAYCR